MGRIALSVAFLGLGLRLAAGPLVGEAAASPAIVIDASSGQVLYAQDPTASWYPASLTKLMTAYVALKAVKEGRIALQTPMMVSSRAASMAPSKMGFRPGSLVTLENALKMLMVKSANDIAVTIAEGVSGSVEAFASEMNQQAAAIGMRESHFVNPNGLPSSAQVTSARDMAVLGRALYIDFPEQAGLFNIGALRLGDQIIPTHNGMLGRYPGADGMKTGFTCAAGFNLVASATRGGRKLIVAVLGAPSVASRTMWAAALLDKAFAGESSGSGSAQALASQGARAAPDQHNAACRNRGPTIAALEAEVDDISRSTQPAVGFSLFGAANAPFAFAPPSGGALSPARQIASLPRPSFAPEEVYVGPAPGWNGPIARPNGASEKVLTAATQKSETAEEPAPTRARPGNLRNHPDKTHANPDKTHANPDKTRANPDKTRANTDKIKGRAMLAHKSGSQHDAHKFKVGAAKSADAKTSKKVAHADISDPDQNQANNEKAKQESAKSSKKGGARAKHEKKEAKSAKHSQAPSKEAPTEAAPSAEAPAGE